MYKNFTRFKTPTAEICPTDDLWHPCRKQTASEWDRPFPQRRYHPQKTIERLSRNLHSFGEKQPLMQNYLALVNQHVKEDYAVIVIDNSDIAKPASRKLEVLAEIREESTGEITQGYLTIEAAVLSESGKMPLPVYEKVFSSAEDGFVSETHENLRCLESLSENFSKNCVRTLDRGVTPTIITVIF